MTRIHLTALKSAESVFLSSGTSVKSFDDPADRVEPSRRQKVTAPVSRPLATAVTLRAERGSEKVSARMST